MCLSFGDMTIEMADFEVDFCSHTERFVKYQDLDKAITKVIKTFDGSEQREGTANVICSKDVWHFWTLL